MSEVGQLRLTTVTRLKEKRLALLLEAGGAPGASLVSRAILDAQIAGSLALAGASTPKDGDLLRQASQLAIQEVFSPGALLRWYGILTGSAAFRQDAGSRPGGPPPCPPEFIEARLNNTAHWFQSDSGARLRPAERGALVLARVLEILPFPCANGRVARLAASHVMVQGGARPPILDSQDRARLENCLTAAFQLSTQPLVALLEEASDRALDVALRSLEAAQP